MELSYKILSVRGIEIELHVLFIVFILLLLAVSPLLSLLMVIAFLFVTIHELAHSLVALRNGVRVKRIILLPIGGMSVVDTMDIKPITEIKIAIAGPLINFVFVYFFLMLAALLNLPLNDWIASFAANPSFFPGVGETLLLYSFYANYALGFFNLIIPAFPMDGGRILRAVLAFRTGYIRATSIARTVSLAITAFLFIIAMQSQNLMLMVIAFFIGIGATSEYETTVFHRALRRITVANVISKDYVALRRDDSVATAVRKMVAAQALSALCGDRVVELAALAGLPRGKWRKEAARKYGVKAAAMPQDAAEMASRTMAEHGVGMLPVYSGIFNRTPRMKRRSLAGVVYRSDIDRMAKIVETINRNGKDL